MKLYIIHGWTYNLDKWVAFIDELKKSGIEVVQLKVPGLTDPSDKVWDIDGYVNWLDTKLQNENAPIVLGHSNGGRIALSYAQKHPGRIKQLILIDSAGVPANATLKILKRHILKMLAKIGKIFSGIPGVKNVFYKVIGGQDYLNAPPNMKITMQNMLKADKLLDLASIQTPTTLIWGSSDSYTPISDGKVMAQKLPQNELHIIEGAKHSPFFTHTDQTVEHVLKALEASV